MVRPFGPHQRSFKTYVNFSDTLLELALGSVRIRCQIEKQLKKVVFELVPEKSVRREGLNGPHGRPLCFGRTNN